MDKSVLKQFLKAGFVFNGELFPTEDGTPQGGVISPILWIFAKYWHSRRNYSKLFCAEKKELRKANRTPIVRHTRIRMDANPYLEAEYFSQRKFSQGMKRLSGRFKQIWKFLYFFILNAARKSDAVLEPDDGKPSRPVLRGERGA